MKRHQLNCNVAKYFEFVSFIDAKRLMGKVTDVDYHPLKGNLFQNY